MSREIYRRSVGPHLDRVRYDGGTVPLDIQALIAIQRYYEERKDSIKLLYFPALTGNKIRVSGANNFISKGYDISPNANDATQSTAVNQPYLSGNIAPNEKLCAKNPNQPTNGFLVHKAITFGNTDPWSVTTVINWNGHIPTSSYDVESYATGSWPAAIRILNNSINRINIVTIGSVGPESMTDAGSSSIALGKNTIFTMVADGSGGLKMYFNGFLTYNFASSTNRTVVDFSVFGAIAGKLYAHIIRSQALTPTEVAAEYNLLRSYYPEIESVQIGTQTWATSNYEAVCTPQGTLIPEVQSATTWATSQTLYDNAYNAAGGAGGGTAAIYAGVKAAAMWSHYNNDPAIGAVYGKILNGFARRLMNMDLGYYNTNNPTTPWGWIVSLKSQLQTLVGFGGNALKVAGSVYMNDANGVNSTGFTALGQGKRNSDGTFSNLKAISTFWTQDTNEVLQLNSSDNTATIVSANEVEGHAIRLTKS